MLVGGLAILIVCCISTVSCGSRKGKALDFLVDDLASEVDVYPEYFEEGLSEDNEILSRARPQKNSPIYYIRLPPSPYVLVPGMGYVSRPASIQPPPMVQPQPESQMINLPVKFLSNGKPTNVYSWKPDSPITNLNKGPYYFNGRPSDIFLLSNTYNALYEDGLQNFYP